MAEWLKAHAWKACMRETVSWVRIPLPPPPTVSNLLINIYFIKQALFLPIFIPICRFRGGFMLPFQRLADCPEYRPTLPTHPLSTHPSSACRMPVGLNRRFGHPGQGFGAVASRGHLPADQQVGGTVNVEVVGHHLPVVGFHSRASFWASAIWAGVILPATRSRLLMASLSPATAARFHHLCAWT